jgi:hypothetical protein
MIAVNKSAYGEVIEGMYREMQEYLIYTLLNIGRSDVIMALFLCSNIPTVDSIVTRVKSPTEYSKFNRCRCEVKYSITLFEADKINRFYWWQ